MSKIILQLGDIILISSPKNEILDKNTFFIDYINADYVNLINTNDLTFHKLKIKDKTVGDGSIEKITIINRADSPSYAVQHSLATGVWVNVYFKTDIPFIVSGEITNVEEDMIEITTTTNEVLYINFNYNGLPPELNIRTIEITEKPYDTKEINSNDDAIIPLGTEESPLNNVQLDVQEFVKNIKNQKRDVILKADAIKFIQGDVGTISVLKDVNIYAQRYSLETQLADLLDDLLSTIPANKRTSRVMNLMHTALERFALLREDFSLFDIYGNVYGKKIRPINYRPIIHFFREFNKSIAWVIPVVNNIRRLYSLTEVDDEMQMELKSYADISMQSQHLQLLKEIYDEFHLKTSTQKNRYVSYYNRLFNETAPFYNSKTDELLKKRIPNANLLTYIPTSYSMKKDKMVKNPIFMQVISADNALEYEINVSSRSKFIVHRNKKVMVDEMNIHSFLFMPDPVVQYSKINLPSTNLIDRVSLNRLYVDYEKWCKHIIYHPIQNINDVIIEHSDEPVTKVTNYFLETPITTEDEYTAFINKIIPDVPILFRRLQPYIVSQLSMSDVISYLEPYGVYVDDLSYSQYVEMVEFLKTKTKEYMQKIKQNKTWFELPSTPMQKGISMTIAYPFLSILSQKYQDVIKEYEIEIPTAKNPIYSSFEMLHRLILKDYAQLYTSTVCLQTLDLYVPNNIKMLEKVLTASDEDNGKKFNCPNITLSKYYTSKPEMELDDNKQISFDKKYDKTNYGLLDNFEKEIITMSADKLKLHMVDNLSKKMNLNKEDAIDLVETLLNGHRIVKDGHYAILFVGDDVEYYVRKGGKWVYDVDIQLNVLDEDLHCNLNEKCGYNPKSNQCEQVKPNTSALMKAIMGEFDAKYSLSMKERKEILKTEFDRNRQIIKIADRIYNRLKTVQTQTSIWLNERAMKSEDGKEVSPYQSILNLILSKSTLDFIGTQKYLIQFKNTYTRPALNSTENVGWLYCIKSNLPLLPVFKCDIAEAVLANKDVNYVVNEIIAKCGKASDDGDYWVDRNSGWIIASIGLNEDEQYDDNGFKIVQHDIIIEDEKLFADITVDEKTGKTTYNTPEAKQMDNIISSISFAMGINIENQKSFIIGTTLQLMSITMMNETEYTKQMRVMAAHGKKVNTYNEYFNAGLMYSVLAMFWIGIQCAIPSIKTRKTHPGCIKSFSGFPLEAGGDKSGFDYLICVVNDVKGQTDIWKPLRNKKYPENVQKQIENALEMNEVKQQIRAKQEYLLTEVKETEIPQEYSIAKWREFCPSLISPKITSQQTTNVSNEFKSSLASHLKNGSKKQIEEIHTVVAKQTFYSFAIQEEIQKVVAKNELILRKANRIPYLENACCGSGFKTKVIDFLYSESPHIKEYNNQSTDLSAILSDIKYYQQPITISSNQVTRTYASISKGIDDRLIYSVFIHYCKFRSYVPIPEDFLPFCVDKPDISLMEDSLELTIPKLKEAGRLYKPDNMFGLLQRIGRQSMTNVGYLQQSAMTALKQIQEMVGSIKKEDVKKEISKEDKIMDRFDETFYSGLSKCMNGEDKPIKNYILGQNEKLKNEIREFMGLNIASPLTVKQMHICLKNMDKMFTWEDTIEPSTVVDFYKAYISNFAKSFPNIILNKIEGGSFVPSYHKFAVRHLDILNNNALSYKQPLTHFYGNSVIVNVLQQIIIDTKFQTKLMQMMPTYVKDNTTSALIHEFFLLRIMRKYILLCEENEMLTYAKNTFDPQYGLYMHKTVMEGGKLELRQNITRLFVNYIEIYTKHKEQINITYKIIVDRAYRLKDKEKNLFMDKRKDFSEDELRVDQMLKALKLGEWGKALGEDVRVYSSKGYDENAVLQMQMKATENEMRRNGKLNEMDDLMEQIDEEINQQQISEGGMAFQVYGEDNLDGYDYEENDYNVGEG